MRFNWEQDNIKWMLYKINCEVSNILVCSSFNTRRTEEVWMKSVQKRLHLVVQLIICIRRAISGKLSNQIGTLYILKYALHWPVDRSAPLLKRQYHIWCKCVQVQTRNVLSVKDTIRQSGYVHCTVNQCQCNPFYMKVSLYVAINYNSSIISYSVKIHATDNCASNDKLTIHCAKWCREVGLLLSIKITLLD